MRTRRKDYSGDNRAAATDDPPPCGAISAKRARKARAHACSSSRRRDASAVLPSDAWATVCEFVSYADLRNLSVVSRFFLGEIMPKMVCLRVDSINELHVAPAHRFPRVTEVRINCLLEDANKSQDVECAQEHRICVDAANRVVPFASRFPKLERLYLQGHCAHEDKRFYYDADFCLTVGHREVMRSLFGAFSGAFAVGLLPTSLRQIAGLVCPSTFEEEINRRDKCEICHQALATFPINTFYVSCSLDSEYIYDCCTICPTELNILKAKLARSDVDTFDRSEYLGELLLSGTEVPKRISAGILGKPTIVDYSEDILQTIEQLLSSPLTPRLVVSADKASEWMSKNFKELCEDDDVFPPREKRGIFSEVFDRLVSLGIPLRREDFRLIRRSELIDDEQNHDDDEVSV